MRANRAKPSLELVLAGGLCLLFPASMTTPWGSLGVYVSTAVAVVCVVGVVRVRPSFAEVRDAAPLVMLGIVVVSTGLAAMTSAYDLSYIRGTPAQWGAFVAVITLARLWQVRGGNPRRWLRWLLWASVAISSLAIWEYGTKGYVELDRLYSALTGISFDDGAYRRASDTFRSISTMGNPLPLGTLTSVAAAGAFGLYLNSARVKWLAVFLVNLIATFTTLSRSSWLAIACSATAILILYVARSGIGPLRMHLHLIVVAVLLVGMFAIPAFQEKALGAIETLSDTASERIFEQDSISYSHRMNAPSVVLEAMAEKPYSLPLGLGLGAENSFFLANTATPLTGNTARDASLIRTFDNTYLTIAYSFGIVGLIWFMRMIWQRVASWIHAGQSYWYLGALSAVMICLYFYNGISAPSASYLAACLLAFDPVPAIPPRADAHNPNRC